jgi:hypothetical protein
MPDPILNILQGEQVYFDPDSTVGATASYSWTFPGGTPGNSASHYPVVTYNNIGDYNASLTVTDTYGTSRTLTKYQIISVDKNVLTVNFTVPGSPVEMNELFTITDTSSPVPTDWEWVLPGFANIVGVQNLINYQYGDWYDATGTYLGDPGATASIPIQLTAATNFDIGTKTQNMVVKKLGAGQDEFDLSYEWVSVYGPTAYVMTSSLGTTGGAPFTLGSYGLTGNSTGFIVVVDLTAMRTVGPAVPGTGFQTNNYFHSNEEIAQYTGHFGYVGSTSPYPFGLTGYVIVDSSAYTTALFSLNTPITAGRYMLKDYVLGNRGGMFADRGAFLRTKWNAVSSGGRAWPLALLNEFLNMAAKVRMLSRDVEEPYLSVGGTGGGFPPLLYTNILSSVHGNFTISNYGVVAIPSSGFMLPRTNPAGDQYLKIYITVHWSNGIDMVQTNFDASAGLSGNDGYGFFKAQDVGPNLGIASVLNQSITSYFTPIGSGIIPIRVKESEDYNPYFVPTNFVYGLTGYNNRSDYHGILIESIDATVTRIEITDNSSLVQWTVPVIPSTGVGLSGPAAFPSDWLNPANARFRYASWLGCVDDQTQLNPMPGIIPGPSGGWYYGGSL